MQNKIPDSEATVSEIVDHVRRDAGDAYVVVGPVGKNARTGCRPYFIVATCDRQQQFRCDQVMAGAEGRARFIARLADHEPLVALDLDDELEMARLCEALWPGEQVTRLREAVEQEAGFAP